MEKPHHIRHHGKQMLTDMEENQTQEAQRAKKAWNNKAIPVIIRRGGALALRLRVPEIPDTETWLRDGPRKRRPVWISDGRYWELPASRFNDLVKLVMARFECIHIIQPYREKEVCARACMEAHGFECQCSCMGAHHGCHDNDGWYEVADTFAVRYGDKRLACRLLKTKG